MKLNSATKITIARIICIFPTLALFIAAQLLHGDSEAYLGLLLASAVLFVCCCLTDIADGYVARRTNSVSDLGKFLDPLADKIVFTVMLFAVVLFSDGLTMGGAYRANPIVMTVLGGVVLARELTISSFRAIAASKNVVLAADIFGKLKTVFLNVASTALILAGLHPVIGWIGTIVFYIGCALAIFSGVRYIVKNKDIFKNDNGAENCGNNGKKADLSGVANAAENCNDDCGQADETGAENCEKTAEKRGKNDKNRDENEERKGGAE